MSLIFIVNIYINYDSYSRSRKFLVLYILNNLFINFFIVLIYLN